MKYLKHFSGVIMCVVYSVYTGGFCWDDDQARLVDIECQDLGPLVIIAKLSVADISAQQHLTIAVALML